MFDIELTREEEIDVYQDLDAIENNPDKFSNEDGDKFINAVLSETINE